MAKKGFFFDTVKSIRVRECLDDIKEGRMTNGKKQTLSEIGLEIGYTPETISRIKNGHVEVTMEFAQSLIDHYCKDIRLEYLMGRDSFRNTRDKMDANHEAGFLMGSCIKTLLRSRGIDMSVKFMSDAELEYLEESLRKVCLTKDFPDISSFPHEFTLSWNNVEIHISSADFLCVALDASDAFVSMFKKMFEKKGCELLPVKKVDRGGSC